MPKAKKKPEKAGKEKSVINGLADMKLSPEAKAAMARYLPYMEEAQKKLLQVVIVLLVTAIIGGQTSDNLIVVEDDRYGRDGRVCSLGVSVKMVAKTKGGLDIGD